MKPSQIRDMIRDAGRIPAERYTNYSLRKVYDQLDNEKDPQDLLEDNVEEIFGSYNKLIGMDNFRFEHPRKAAERTAG